MMIWRSVRIDYFTDPPESLSVCHFASGSSAIGDMRGFSRILYPFGVTASDLRANALAALVSLAHLPIRVFVDSGAFSEVEMGPHNQRFRELIHACRESSPDIEISCDSNLIAAHVGKANGRDGEARALTAAEQLELETSGERSRESAIVYAFGPAAIFRRTIQNSTLGPSARFRAVGAVPRIHTHPEVVAEFGDVQPPAKQLDLFSL